MEKSKKIKRRYFTREQKAKIMKAFCSGQSCSELAGQYRLHPALIYKWRKEMRHQETNNKSVEYKELLSEQEEKDQKIENLQKALSDNVIKVEILKKARPQEILKKKHQIKEVWLAKEVIGCMEGCSKTLVCRVLGVSRFSIYWKPKGESLFQRGGYKKKEDDLILKEIKEVVKVRPSYGYKRVTVLVNKARILRGE